MRNILFIAMVVLLFSCEENKAKIAVQKKYQTPQEMLLGNWTPFDTFKKGSMNAILHSDRRGFEFLPDSICEYKNGYMDIERYENDTTIDREEKVMYELGTKTKYSFTKDSLKIFNLTDKKWDGFKIKKLTGDTLIISRDKGWSTFIKKEYETQNVPDFDAVIVSASTCFGPYGIYNDIKKWFSTLHRRISCI